MNAATCICPMGLPPFDHLLESNPLCLAHRVDIQLVAAGWLRTGDRWSKKASMLSLSLEKSFMHYLLTEDEAYDILLAKDKP